MINDRNTSGLRRIMAAHAHPGAVHAVVRDDLHHFRIVARHDGTVVTGITGEALRTPFSSCGNAVDALAAVKNVPLSPRMTDIIGTTNGRLQCTHQFDLTAFAIAMAARGGSRRYDMLVSDPVDKRSIAQLRRNDGFTMEWIVDGRTITSPAPLSGISVDHGFTSHVAALEDTDMAEACLLLRRAHFILKGRVLHEKLNSYPTAAPLGHCWVMQPGRAHEAKRVASTPRDGTLPLDLDPADKAWLENA